MKNAIIIHGIDETREDMMEMPNSPSNCHWFPWLQFQLVKNDILAQTPEMPYPYLVDMKYEEWAKVFSGFELNENSILIGHSAGSGFLLKYLSLNPDINPGHLILVAPWLDIDGEHPTFFKGFDLDKDLSKRINKIDVFYSTDDMENIVKTVNKIKSIYDNKITYREFSDKGHFVEGVIGKEFPELLDIVLNK